MATKLKEKKETGGFERLADAPAVKEANEKVAEIKSRIAAKRKEIDESEVTLSADRKAINFMSDPEKAISQKKKSEMISELHIMQRAEGHAVSAVRNAEIEAAREMVKTLQPQWEVLIKKVLQTEADFLEAVDAHDSFIIELQGRGLYGRLPRHWNLIKDCLLLRPGSHFVEFFSEIRKDVLRK